MRIAYIANYQGTALVAARPCLRNLSLAARVKIQLIAELLQGSGHEVEIISQGAVEAESAGRRSRRRFYPALTDRLPFHRDIPIHYVSAIDVRFLTGVWESWQAQCRLRAGHLRQPYDAVMIYNLSRAQIGCAHYARQTLGLPVILQYEDDAFVTVHGHTVGGAISRYQRHLCRQALACISGGTGVTPYLLTQMRDGIPKLLLRGVVSNEIATLQRSPKQNRVVFSGTHESTQGLTHLLDAWRAVGLPDWQLHIAGEGPLTPELAQMAADQPNIVMHGLLDRPANARLLATARIGMNPQDLTVTPGNVFPFKIVEYLASGAHVISTPRGPLERELEAGVTYIANNNPAVIARCLRRVITERLYERTAESAALQTYGPAAVTRAMNNLLRAVVTGNPREYQFRPYASISAAETR